MLPTFDEGFVSTLLAQTCLEEKRKLWWGFEGAGNEMSIMRFTKKTLKRALEFQYTSSLNAVAIWATLSGKPLLARCPVGWR